MNIGIETETVEFKKSTSEMKEAVISISSILNKHGAGVLYFGVKDNGDVVGQIIGKETQRDISRAISGNIKPSCWYEIELRSTNDGASFIEVSFRGNDAPYSAYGKYYQRFADEDKLMSDSELEILFLQRRKDYSEWENRKSNCRIEDVDMPLLKKVIKEGNQSNHLKYEYKSKDDALNKFGLLLNDKKTLNNAGEVLFSKNKPVLLKLATFASSNKKTFVKLEHFEGNIFECIDKGIEYIGSQINYRIEFEGRSSRKELPEIPLSAVREIIVNAFAHANYDSNTAFEIDVFKDRVTIYSPGHFPRGYTPEDFASGTQKPVMLNPRIVEVLFRTGRIESFGSGFERTFLECSSEGVDYSYNETKSGFEFIFFRPLGHKNVQEMSKTEKAVLEEIRKNNYITAKLIAEQIGKSEKTVYRAIKRLKEFGYIVRIGDDYDGHWEVKTNEWYSLYIKENNESEFKC